MNSLICFDDPHNVKKAESETERQAVIDWWDGTMASRGALAIVRATQEGNEAKGFYSDKARSGKEAAP